MALGAKNIRMIRPTIGMIRRTASAKKTAVRLVKKWLKVAIDSSVRGSLDHRVPLTLR
jgi:hypothetical protein